MDNSAIAHNRPRYRFWVIQCLVWVAVGLINFIPQHVASSIPLPLQYLNLTGICFGGLLITSLYRFYLKKYNYRFTLRAGDFIVFLLGSALVQSVVWLLLFLVMSLPFVERYHLSLLHLAFNLVPLTGIILVWNMVYLSYHLMRQYHNSEIEKWKLEAEVQKANLGNLRSQINPHFMFNALNNIRALITEDPQRARYMLTVFAENFRYALRHAENKKVVVEEEIAVLEKYLELLKIQYEEKLQYTIHADNAALKQTIPPMILQLLVENGIKHGIALSPTGGMVEVNIAKLHDRLQLTVKNTGTIQHQAQLEDSPGVGLKNIKDRLALLYQGKASLTIEEQAPFVAVTINIYR